MNTIYNILIVEDDEEIGDAVEIYLRNQGYRIFKGHNGYEGLEIIKNLRKQSFSEVLLVSIC